MKNLLSVASIKLDLFTRTGTHSGTASGFILEAANRYYIVTAWQVLSGRDFFTGEPLDSESKPYPLETLIPIPFGSKQTQNFMIVGYRKPEQFSLLDEDDKPTWLELTRHEEAQPRVDIAAIPIESEFFRRLEIMNEFGNRQPGGSIPIKLGPPFELELPRPQRTGYQVPAIPVDAIDTDIAYGPTDPVHIIGYPVGLTVPDEVEPPPAFWKTGSIAREMTHLISGGAFLIDTISLDGMSGAPVVGLKGGQCKLLGVYSGGYKADIHPTIGLVWLASFIKRLVIKPDDSVT